MITLSSDRYNLICGKTGFGKSSYLKAALRKRKMLDDGNVLIIFDANNQHADTKCKRFVPGESIAKDFETLVKSCYDSGKKVHLVVEEAQEVVGHSATPYIRKWLRTGRNDGITATFITQIPADLHGSILSNSTSIVIFRLPRPEDRGYLAAWLGVGGATVQQLPKFQYMEISDDAVIRGEVVMYHDDKYGKQDT